MTENEIWKWVTGYEGSYEVSSLGNMRSYRKTKTPKPMKPRATKDGYLTICLINKSFRIHRLVAQAFLDDYSSKMQVNHKNGNKKDNRASNLEWMTCRENVIHSFEVLGRKNPVGSLCNLSKLTEDQIREIRLVHAATHDTLALSKRFGVTTAQIRRICNRKNWKHVN